MWKYYAFMEADQVEPDLIESGLDIGDTVTLNDDPTHVYRIDEKEIFPLMGSPLEEMFYHLEGFTEDEDEGWYSEWQLHPTAETIDTCKVTIS